MFDPQGIRCNLGRLRSVCLRSSLLEVAVPYLIDSVRLFHSFEAVIESVGWSKNALACRSGLEFVYLWPFFGLQKRQSIVHCSVDSWSSNQLQGSVKSNASQSATKQAKKTPRVLRSFAQAWIQDKYPKMQQFSVNIGEILLIFYKMLLTRSLLNFAKCWPNVFGILNRFSQNAAIFIFFDISTLFRSG